MTGTPSQIEWAERIKPQVAAEFDRVAAAFQAVAGNQSESGRARTQAILAILEEKRAEVMGRRQAGYFIRNWQEIGGRVRQMLLQDARYQSIRSNRHGLCNVRRRAFRSSHRSSSGCR